MKSNKRTLSRRTVLGISNLLIVMLVVGSVFGFKMNQMLIDNIENQLTEQAVLLADYVDQSIRMQYIQLNNIANAVRNKPQSADSVLQTVKREQEGVNLGMVALDGSLVFGYPVTMTEFEGIQQSFRGNEAVSYCKGKGLMFSVPVYNDENVRFVLYKIYDEAVLKDTFGHTTYKGAGQVLWASDDYEVIVPFVDESYLDGFVEEDGIQKAFELVGDEMKVATSVSSYAEYKNSKYFIQVSELLQHGIYVMGIVPQDALSEGIMYITSLVLWVFGLLLVLFIIVGVYLFITAEKAQESEELRAARDEAQQANAAKSEFLANMSHEIRTPIHVIIGMNEMVMRECDDGQIKTYSENIRKASLNLLSLISDIIDFSKLETQKAELKEEDYPLDALLDDVITVMQYSAEERGLLFEKEIDSDLPKTLRGDAVNIRHIMLNLLNNAVKYTKRGKISLRITQEEVSEEDITLKIEVSDTGIGIKEEDVQKLFKNFQRLDIRKNRSIEGSGLGLAITKRLLDCMNGRIEVKSVYGKGSVFTVYIPQKIVDIGRIGDFPENEPVNIQQMQIEQFLAPDANILIVDDHDMNLFVMESLLKCVKAKVFTCESGEACLRQMSHQKFDVIFLDHMMPEMDGIETLKRMKEMNLKKDAVVIALTANAVSGAREMYLDKGFDDYLCKPVEMELLVKMLMKYLPENKKSTTNSVGRTENTIPYKTSAKGQTYIEKNVGLKYCAYSEEMYYEFLKMYCDGYETKVQQLTDNYADENWPDYSTYVHALKSTSLNIGGVILSELAAEMERITKQYINDGQNENLSYIKSHHEELMKLYHATIEEARIMVQ